MKNTLSILLSILLLAVFCTGVFAAPPGSSSSSISRSGAATITSAATQTGKTYSSTAASQNALLINTSSAVNIINATVTKSGGTSAGDDESFYGINSAIMCKGGSHCAYCGKIHNGFSGFFIKIIHLILNLFK